MVRYILGTLLLLTQVHLIGFPQTMNLAGISTLPDPVALIKPQNPWAYGFNDSITFVWHKGNEDVKRYWFEIALDSNFVFFVSDSALTDTSKGIRFNNDTGYPASVRRYYWRVRAANDQGWGAYSETRWLYLVMVSVNSSTLGSSSDLLQCFPSPFNASTIIRYSIPSRTHVLLEVYSTLGQKVATLSNAVQEAGVQELTFNGSMLASGTYIVRLQTIAGVRARAVLLLK